MFLLNKLLANDEQDIGPIIAKTSVSWYVSSLSHHMLICFTALGGTHDMAINP